MTLHGVIPIRKPKGYTSHDIVGFMRRLTGQKRVGHTGTLDPEVEGVLPICLGQATRIVEYIQDLPKRYAGTMKLGISTDTEDQTGQVLEEVTVPSLSLDEIHQVFQRFRGEIEQIPPMYSAVRVHGKRLYELARAGVEVERPKRKVMIYDLDCTGMEAGEHPLIHFDVRCSKGTYIRTLCVDLGLALGYPAHMTQLTRVQSGPFHLSDCYTLEELKEVSAKGHWQEVLFSMDEVLGQYPSFIVADEDEKRVLDGWDLEIADDYANSLVRVYTESGRFCAIYRIDGKKQAKPEKVFRDVES
ncbi:tRNA pseudouridine(55) synthase TruB [Thermoflavimicrobium dichotomicum]|uniref:tRNA pseudouridine synthase B n=1 Tax=Thermoflavimicrobium dichotomicum TaxID=46223 RepID=A0A1I3PQ88_9BACL|nr:tRNA pseudouridine(55) synthase TruB [Thermoflavimicrobium dichotomicum]SFJ23431.1 tRNA pseudouridine55 synthase [Thermoflavimicrobium dichotomicum]